MSNFEHEDVLELVRSGLNLMPELAEIFAEESAEHFLSILDGLDRLRVDRNDNNALQDTRRSAHTLKGAAAAVGSNAVSELAKCIENFADELTEHNLGPSDEHLELFLITTETMQTLGEEDPNLEESATAVAEILNQFAQAQLENQASDPSTEPTAETEAVDAVSDSHDEPTIEAVSLDTVLSQLQSSSQIEPELMEIFGEEAEEHMLTIYRGLERLRSNYADEDSLAEVRRSSHTLKGAAGAVGLEAVTRLSHRMEDLLDHIAENRLTLTENQVSLMLNTADKLQDLTAGQYDIEETAQAMVSIYQGYDVEMQALGAFKPAEQSAPEVTTSDESQPEPQTAAPEISSSDEVVSKTDAKASEAKSSDASSNHYLRVPLERLDSLVSVIGEMVVNRSAFNQRLSDFQARIEDMQTSLGRFRSVTHEMETKYSVEALKSGSSQNPLAAALHRDKSDLDALEFDRYTDFHLLARSLSEATNDVAVITNELRNLYGDFDSLLGRQQRFNRDAQDSLMHIRMVPVANIVNRLGRTVRTVSNKLGKNVELSVVGGSTELDKTVLEEITDPILHLIRNALDHGIEAPSERERLGKPAKASLAITALNQGTQVTIRVTDDGRGIDPEKIRLKGIERGLISETDELSQNELYGLIFTPGFSTADTLTDVSGRGVGMDVVRNAVQQLKGTIHVDSEVGKGSTFTIHLPTTLAVARALLIESSGHTFAVPMQAVQQILRLDPTTVCYVDKKPMVNLGDDTLQLKNLSTHMHLRGDDATFDETLPTLLIRAGDDLVAITVDTVLGGQDIVIKTLGDHLRSVPGYLGATIAGDGTVIPILDPSDLCGQQIASSPSNFTRRDQNLTRRKTAMVIDDSLSVRRVTTNLLRGSGWNVLEAKDGIDALEVLAAADVPPDIFLCDMEMPRMDGLELIGRIRGQAEFETTPIVMVTSRAAEKHRRMAAEAGANEHVVKPFKDDELTELIEQLVREHRELVRV